MQTFEQLVDSLHACHSKESLRKWALDTMSDRMRLSQDETAQLRKLAIAKQNAIRAAGH